VFSHLPPPDQIAAIIIVLFLGIGLHEFAHCKFADMAGDPTPSFYGRVTLNLFRHFEPAGTMMMVFSALSGYGIGWGRPAPMDWRKMRNPRWDFFLAVLAGPVSNIVQAVIYALLFRLTLAGAPGMLISGNGDPTFLGYFGYFGIAINMSLAIFNLVPLGPLDGHWLVGLLMHEVPRHYWYSWNRAYGRMILLVVIIFGQYMSQQGMPQFDLFMRFVFPIAAKATAFLLGGHSPI
jgi:Zn-dependent protease